MNLLGAVLYDPAGSVTKGAAASVMAAFDTTNARVAFTVPASGRVKVIIEVTLHGATTFSQYMLGVLEGATLRGRVVPRMTINGTALATTMCRLRAEYTVTGLTPGGAVNWDAAWGCETFVASSLMKYGGANDTTANNAFGALVFEVWDPSPLQVSTALLQIDSNGRVDIGEVNGTAVTAAAGRMEVNTTHAAGTAWGSGAITAASIAADAITAAKIADNAIDAGSIATGALTAAKFAAGAIDASALAADAGTEIATAVWASGTRTLTANPGLDAAGVRAAVGLAAADLDTQLGALPTAAEIRIEMDANSTDLDAIGVLATNIFARTDVATSTRMATFVYAAPDNAGIAAIKAKTDSLTFTVANKLDVNLLVVNGVTLQGTGTALDKWRAV